MPIIQYNELPERAMPAGLPYEAMRGGKLVQLQDFTTPRFDNSRVIQVDQSGNVQTTLDVITVIHSILS